MKRLARVGSLAWKVAALALVSPTSSMAVEVTGQITQLWVNDSSGSNVAWILTTASFTNSCGTGPYFVVDLSQPGMKEIYGMALSAFHTGATVTIGTDICYRSHERLKFMYLSR
jgi:hypothetical protein